MDKLKIISFKRGIVWFAVCEIPEIEYFKPTYYYDVLRQEISATMNSNATLHTIALSNNKVNKKMKRKLEQYLKKRGVIK